MNLLEMSGAAVILIIGIIIIRSVAMHRLPHKLFLILWGMAGIRLCVPIAIPMNISMLSLVKSLLQHIPVNSGINEYNKYLYGEGTVRRIAKNADIAGAAQGIINHADMPVFIYIWLIGMAGLLLYFTVSYIRQYRILQESIPIKGNPWIEQFSCDNHGRCNIKVTVSDRIAAPITYGFFKPKIVLHKEMDFENKEQLAFIMAHELVHIKRFDNLWKIVMVFAFCLHWFNPFVWIMYVLFNRDLEISCDETVVAKCNIYEKEKYVMTMLAFAEQKSRIQLLYSGFGQRAIKERIVAVMKYKKATVISIGCAAALVVISISVFSIDVSKKTEGTAQEAEEVRNKLSIAEEIAKSDTFDEYEKYGISYRKKEGKLYYEGEPVGYFYDEMAENAFNNLRDEEGSIGVRTIRDDQYVLQGFEEVDFKEVDFQEGLCQEFAEEVSDDDMMLTIKTENTASEEAADDDMMLTIKTESTASEEGTGDRNTLQEYATYKVFYNDNNYYIYNDKKVAGLYDKDYMVYIYGENLNDDSVVYLQAVRENGEILYLQEISEEKMQELIEEENAEE